LYLLTVELGIKHKTRVYELGLFDPSNINHFWICMNKYKILKNILLDNEKKEVAFIFIGMLFLGVFEMAGVASIVPFMGMVSDSSIILTNKYINYVYVLFEFDSLDNFLFASGFFVLSLLAVSNIFTTVMHWKMQSYVHMQEHRLAVRMLEKYLSQNYGFFLNRNTSDLTKNILTEIGRAMSGVILPILQVISKVIITLLLLLLLILSDPFLAITIITTLGVIYIGIFTLVRKKLHNIGINSTKAITQRYKILNELFSSVKILKLKGGEGEFIEWFSKPSLKYARFSAISAVISHAPRYLLEVVAFGGIMIIVLYYISKGESNSHIVSYMALYAFAGYRLLPALQSIYSGITLIHYNYPALEAIYNDLILTEKEVINSKQRECDRTIFSKKLDLRGIYFNYPNTSGDLLKNINISIYKNSTIGIVGETGSGKSTLIDIILGLHMPNDGGIYVDDTKIINNVLHDWQRCIGYVPQDIYLSDDSIFKNIAFMVPEEKILLDDVVKVAKAANIHDFIVSLPQQYDTKVGERGVRLSGGQKQRIGIARALYGNPQLLVLDEATSAMDSLTENAVMDAIHNLRHEKTIIMVAHRITTIKECDVIYMLENGCIVDHGTFDELCLNNDKFKRMAKK
jgi:ABC-type multidrug transport system fused ATPase/permease subunit